MARLQVTFAIPYYKNSWDWWKAHLLLFFSFPDKGHIIDKYTKEYDGCDNLSINTEIQFCEKFDITPDMRFCENTFTIDRKVCNINTKETIYVLEDNYYVLAYDTPVTKDEALKISEARKKLMLKNGWTLVVS